MAEKFPDPLRPENSNSSSENTDEENASAPVPDTTTSEGLFARSATGEEFNRGFEGDLPMTRDQHTISAFRHNEARRFLSMDEASSRADIMASTRPPMSQRSMSHGFERDTAATPQKTRVGMSPVSPGSKQTGTKSYVDEASRDIELAEAGVSGACGGAFAPNRYSESAMADPRILLRPKGSGSRDSAYNTESARTSTLSTATTVSDETRKSRVTITPLLDQYYRNRPTAIVAEVPGVSDRDNLVDNEAPVATNPQDPPAEGAEAAAPPPDDDCPGTYYIVTNKIINSPFMLIFLLVLGCWSFFCIYEGFKYMRICPATDTFPLLFVFLGLTSCFSIITRMFHIAVRRFAAYQLIANVIKWLQSVMFIGYFFIYILELATFFLLDLQSLPEVCVIEYYNFTYWNTWLQIPVILIIIFLHGPSAYRTKWYCLTSERT